MKNPYENLGELLADPHSPKQKVGTTIINGRTAYKVTIGGFGQNYGIMFENDQGVFEFDFVNINDESKLTQELETIIDSIKFKEV